MGVLWTPEAEDLKAAGESGVMEGGQPKVTWHVTVSPSGKTSSGGDYFDVMHRVLVGKKAEPHYLYDPVTDRLGQYFPLNRSARALANDGARRTNGSGVCNIQIEVVAQADDFTRYWKPGPNFRALMRDIRSWGVPDVWPNGNPCGTHTRSWSTYTKAGHFGHLDVPGNDHVDPQVADGSLLFQTAPAKEEDEVTPQDIKAIADEVLTRPVKDLDGNTVTVGAAIGYMLRNSVTAVNEAKAARALAEATAVKGSALTAADVTNAVKSALASGIALTVTAKGA